MGDDQDDDLDVDYYENINYRELLKLQPDDFYLHLPLQIPFSKWLFEARLQLLLACSISPNYFGMRHRLDPIAQWFADWIFLNHYMRDYLYKKSWKPKLTDRLRYWWLIHQGYAKEHSHYFELSERNDNREVTVQERKFLKHYVECRYFSYFDSVRDDELAFYRMGVDRDEPLVDENKPLFPNIAYSTYGDPQLAYVVSGRIDLEHIPVASWWFAKRKARKKMLKKWENDEKVTYADMRVMFNAETTKIHDLEFMLHCYSEHGGKPKDKVERALFETLRLLYTNELTHLLEVTKRPGLNKLVVSGKRKPINPLYLAYKARWFGVNPVREFEKVFHGVTLDEYQEIVNEQYVAMEVNRRLKSRKKSATKRAAKRAEDILADANLTK